MSPLSLLFLVVSAAAVVGGAKRSTVTARIIKLRPTRPHEGGPVGVHRGPEHDQLVWSRFATGSAAEQTVHVGDVPFGAWRVELYAVSPRIDGGVRFPTKVGKKDYGWNDPPPDGSRVIEAGVKALNTALDLAGPVIEGGAQALGAPPGVAATISSVVQSLIDAIPSAVRKARVDYWSKWREGKRGNAAERRRVRAAVSKWRDENGAYALKSAHLLGYWRWEGAGGELPEDNTSSGGKPIPHDPAFLFETRPTASLELLGNGASSRVRVVVPATSKVPTGERRYVVLVTSLDD